MIFETPEKEIIEILEKGPIFKKKLIIEAGNVLSFTPQSVYRVVKKLLERRIIVENDKKIAISGSFIAQLREYFVKLSKIYHGDNAVKEFLAKLTTTNKETFNFDNYEEFNRFWEHLGVLLKKNEQEKRYYVLIEPSAYWFRYTHEQSTAYIKLLQSYGYKIVWCMFPISSESERSDVEKLRAMNVEVIFDETLDITKTYNIFENYLIEATYEDSWMRSVHEAYVSGLSQESTNIILNSQSTFRLQVYKDSKKQEKWWNKIKKEII